MREKEDITHTGALPPRASTAPPLNSNSSSCTRASMGSVLGSFKACLRLLKVKNGEIRKLHLPDF